MGEKVIKYIICGVIVIIIGIVGYAIYINSQSNKRVQEIMREDSVPVYVEHAKMRSIYPTIENLSITLHSDSEMEEIILPVSGVIEKSYISKIGQRVKKGDVLAVLTSQELEADIDSSEGEIAEARAKLINAQITEERYGNLVKLDGVSKQEYDSAVTSRVVAEGALKSAIAKKEHLSAQKDKLVIRALSDGDIITVNCTQGMYVTAGQLLFIIGDFSKLTMWMTLNDKLIRKYDLANNDWELILKKEVLAKNAYPGHIVGGADDKIIAKTDKIYPSMDEEAKKRNVYWTISNQNNFLEPTTYHGVTVKALKPKQCLTVSNGAIKEGKGKIFVLVCDKDNIAHLKSIVIGVKDNKYTEVLSGIDKEDLVIYNGDVNISDGTKVTVLDN